LAGSPKIKALKADFSKPDFALSCSDFAMLQTDTTHIIHCAWPVNFALSLASFSPQLAGLHNLLAFSLSVLSPEPAHVLFCSSIGAAMATSPPATIPEAPLDLIQASSTGYARSKLVAEHIMEHASVRCGAKATILRIGQIVPSRSQGSQLWNPNEAIPLMIRSSILLGALPDRTGSGDRCSWLEADIVAKVVVDICRLKQDNPAKHQLVYNLVHPRPFSWRDEFLPALKAAGLPFETVSLPQWLEKLAQSSSDLNENPSRKLLHFWEEHSPGMGESLEEIRFETEKCQEASPALAIAESSKENISVEALVDAWRKVW
jgi:thioester reductase-like protein